MFIYGIHLFNKNMKNRFLRNGRLTYFPTNETALFHDPLSAAVYFATRPKMMQ